MAWVDIYRGVAILGVLVAHVGGRFLREVPPDSEAWWIIATVNRGLAFVVPAFLFLSTLLIGLSMARNPQGFSWPRLRAVLWPYLVWTLFYLGVRALEGNFSLNPQRWLDWLLWGKTYFHLYYMVLALQLTLFLPLVWLAIRKVSPFWLAVSGVAITLGFYWANRLWWQLPYPGSWLLWYWPTIVLGLMLLPRFTQLPQLMQQYRVWAWAFLGIGMWLYLPLAYDAIRNIPVNTFQYQAGYWIYSSAVSFLLIPLSIWLAQGRMSRVLEFLGKYSLPIYLIHPLVIRGLERTPHFPEVLGVSPAFAIYVVLGLAVPLAFALAAQRTKTAKLWFGR